MARGIRRSPENLSVEELQQRLRDVENRIRENKLEISEAEDNIRSYRLRGTTGHIDTLRAEYDKLMRRRKMLLKWRNLDYQGLQLKMKRRQALRREIGISGRQAKQRAIRKRQLREVEEVMKNTG